MFIRLVYISFFGLLPRVVMLRKGAGRFFVVSGREEIRSHLRALADAYFDFLLCVFRL